MHLQTQIMQALLQQMQVGGVIFSYQHPRRRQWPRRLCRKRQCLGRQLTGVQIQFQPHGGALAWRAAQAQFCFHRCSQFTADRQAQAAAAETARCRCLGLGVGSEHRLLPFRADAHPAVTDLQAKTLAAIVLLQHLHLQIHAAMLGELERVAGKVEQDLAQTQAVGQRSGLQFRIKFDPQMQAPAGRHRHQQLLHRAHQCRQARGSQLQRQCLQPLAVQHVVQDLPQHLGSITHGHQDLLLAMIQIAVLQPLEHAQQGAHRRTDLVAHGCQEVGLGQRCLLGRTARLGQRMGARLHSAYVDPVATPLDVAAVQGQRPSMRVDPAPA